MKRTIAVAAIVAAVAIAATSCVSGPAPAAGPVNDPVSDFIREVRRGAPENALLGIGTSNHTNRGLARTTAETRARAEIARQVEVVINNMILDYTAGSEAQQAALLSFQQNVTSSLAQQTQRGAIIQDETNIGGEQIVIVVLTTDALKNGVMGASQSAAALAPHMGNAMWALDRMDQALSQQNALPPVVRNAD